MRAEVWLAFAETSLSLQQTRRFRYALALCASDRCFRLTLPPSFQLDRLISRDQSTREEALQRVKAQLPTREKVAHELTTEVIWNNGTQEELNREVKACLSRLRGKVTTLDKILTLPGLLLSVGVVVAASIVAASRL